MGKIAYEEFEKLESRYENIKLDIFVVMPNHVHAIFALSGEKNQKDLSVVIGLLKSGISRRIKEIAPDTQIWQRSYHDHIIRNQASYEKIWTYIKYNYQKWEADCFHPTNQKP